MESVDPPLRAALATPDGKSRYTRRVFATIADRYDLITVLLSYGQDRRWKRRLVAMARIGPGTRALDLACGTGDIACEAAAAGARVVGLDLVARMVELAKQRLGRTPRDVMLLVGDMMRLPLADRAFDLVTTGYGLRNVPDLAGSLDEIRRVLKPGGRLLALDFNRPGNAVLRSIYLGYLTMVGSALGFALHGDPDTYRYIPETIRMYPGAAGVARLMRERGFVEVEYMLVAGGLMAIHSGRTRHLSSVVPGPRTEARYAAPMEIDTSLWSGEGDFTRVLLETLKGFDRIAFLRVEDAPASRAEAGYNLIASEFYVGFTTEERRWPGRRFGFPIARREVTGSTTLAGLGAALSAVEAIGPPDYSDEGMLQYLRTEHVVPPYQTRGYKLVELVRIYEIGREPRR